MTEPTAEYQAEQSTDAPSETPVADFLKRNPEATSCDLLLFVLGSLPMRMSAGGGMDSRTNAEMVSAVAGIILRG